MIEKPKNSISLSRKIISKAFYALKLHKFFVGNSIVLMYHRVINPEQSELPLQDGMYVRPDTFKLHLELLTRYAKVVKLDEIIFNNQENSKIKKVSITFDDSWIDFKLNAYPLLKKFNLPATVFVPTKFIGTNKLFWTDTLSLSIKFLKENNIFLEKKIKIDGLDLSLDLEALIESLKKTDPERRNEIIKSLKTNCLELGMKNNEKVFMSWEDLKEISNNSSITFGSHSHNHEISTLLSKEAFNEDISMSILKFKENKLPMSNIFCYPNQDRSKAHDKVLEKLGFKASLASTKEETTDYNLKNIIRLGMHEDVSSSADLFLTRLWLNK